MNLVETTYRISLNYNIDAARTSIFETRAVKRVYKDNESTSTQYLKSDFKTYSVEKADNRIIEMLGDDSYIELSEEITYDQFTRFMDKSCNIFMVEM